MDVVLSPSCRPAMSMPLVLTGAGVAVVGLGLGIGSMIYSSSRDGEADATWVKLDAKGGNSACGDPANKSLCDDLESADADFKTFRGLAIGGFIAGGAAAVATVIYVVTKRSKGPESKGGVSVQAAFSPAPGGGGAVLRGTF